MPWNEGSSRDPSENFLSDLVLGTIWTGVGSIAEVAKAGYGYVSDPQNRENTARNASQFAQNFGKYTPNGREWFFNDPALGFSKYRQNAETQRQQLIDARYQRSQGIQTGFDDEEDNVREDWDRTQWEKTQRSNRYRRATENSYDNSQRGFSPDTVVSSALRSYKQLKQQANYADNSYTSPAYTSYADLQQSSISDYQAPQYNRELKQREWAAKYPEIDAFVKESQSFAKESQSFAKEASARYQRFQSYADLQASLNKR